MKRVLQVLSGLSAGGAESMIMNIYRNLDHTKVQFDFCVFGNENGIFSEEVKKNGGNIFLMPSISKVGIIKYIQKVREVIKKNGPYDIVHSHIDYLSGFVLYAAKKEKVKTRIAHSHNTDALTNKGRINPFLLSIIRIIINANATSFCACSRAAGEYMFGRNKGCSAVVINNAIDLNRFSSGNKYSKDSQVKKLNLNIDSDTQIITHIGRFVEQKNHNAVINIFKEYKKRHPNSLLLLLGEGPKKLEIEKKVEREGVSNVFFLGNRTDIPEILNITSVFILPSIYEGLPVTLIEAQAMGIPCVVSDTIKKDVDCGMNLISFVSTNDICSFVDEIYRSISRRKTESLYEIMTKKGYNIEENICKINKLYNISRKVTEEK